MTKVSELVSQNVGSAITNFKTWGGILTNVKAYGAKGDGVTDDTAAIQAAINAAQSAGGGIVFFPPGSYITTSSLVLSNVSISFIGASLGSVTILPTSAVLHVFYNNTIPASTATSIAPFMEFKNFRIKCATGSNTNGIKIDYSVSSNVFQGFAIDNVEIIVDGGNCLRLFSIAEAMITNSFFNGTTVAARGTTNVGTSGAGISMVGCPNVMISGNSFLNLGTGIYVSGGAMGIYNSDAVIVNNSIENCSTGVGCDSWDILTIADSTIDACDCTFRVTNCDDIIIHDSYLAGNGQENIIQISATTRAMANVSIHNNMIYYYSGQGTGITKAIDIFGSSGAFYVANVLIKDNNISRYPTTGVSLTNITVGQISNNIFGRVNAAPATNAILDLNPAVTTMIQDNVLYANAGVINATGDVIRENVGYATEASGTATVLSAGTSVVVTHGLVVAPLSINIIPLGNLGAWWVTGITATQFTLNVSSAVGVNTSFNWVARTHKY